MPAHVLMLAMCETRVIDDKLAGKKVAFFTLFIVEEDKGQKRTKGEKAVCVTGLLRRRP